jgi:hypothetical protein
MTHFIKEPTFVLYTHEKADRIRLFEAVYIILGLKINSLVYFSQEPMGPKIQKRIKNSLYCDF